MKKQILLPVLAVLFAVGGAFASNRFALTYYASTDFTCQTELPGEIPCIPGEDEVCTEGGSTYRYKDTTAGVVCDPLLKDVNR